MSNINSVYNQLVHDYFGASKQEQVAIYAKLATFFDVKLEESHGATNAMVTQVAGYNVNALPVGNVEYKPSLVKKTSKKVKSLRQWRKNNIVPSKDFRPCIVELPEALPVNDIAKPNAKLSFKPSKALKLARKGFGIVGNKDKVNLSAYKAKDFGTLRSNFHAMAIAGEAKTARRGNTLSEAQEKHIALTASRLPKAVQLQALVLHDKKLQKSANNALLKGKVEYANRLVMTIEANRTKAREIILDLNEQGIELASIPFVKDYLKR
jgi:hypothetical protein